jgi:hypothetical protein
MDHVAVCEGKTLNEAVTCKRISIGGRSVCTTPEHRGARAMRKKRARTPDTPRPKTMAETLTEETISDPYNTPGYYGENWSMKKPHTDPLAEAHRLAAAAIARNMGMEPRPKLPAALLEGLGRCFGDHESEVPNADALRQRLRAAVTR